MRESKEIGEETSDFMEYGDRHFFIIPITAREAKNMKSDKNMKSESPNCLRNSFSKNFAFISKRERYYP